MKKIIVLLFFCLVIFASKGHAQCVNADFSQGDFTNWVGSFGENNTGVYSPISGMVIGTPNSLPSTAGQQTIMNQPGTDPNTGNVLSVIPPGGSSSCRLGNDQVSACTPSDNNNPEGAQLKYIFTVTPTNCIFTYQYAVVLQNPLSSPHTFAEEPKFTIYVLDSAGNQLGGSCGLYEVTAQTGLPGYTDTPALFTICSNSDDVLWKDWTAVGIDLSPWMGHHITVQFTTLDCSLGGHFGYAYIACTCGAMQLSQSCSTTQDILAAPAGYAAYTWTPGGATTQFDTIHNPVNGNTVTCLCTSVTGCDITLHLVINIQPVVFSVNSVTLCPGDSATLIAHSDTTGFTYMYNWSGGYAGDTIKVAPATTTVYTVTASSGSGCTNSATAIVSVHAMTANAGSPAIICPGVSTTLNASASTGIAPLTYAWSPAASLNTSTGAQVIATPSVNTTYIVTVTSGDGCTQTSSVAITLTNITVSATPTNPTICAGASVPLTASGTATSFTWSPGTGLSTTVGASVTASPGTTMTYVVTGTGSGCSVKDSVLVTVVPLPNAQIVSSTPATCGTSNGTATASTGTGYSYLWSDPAHQTTVTATGLAAGTYTVTISVSPGCTDTAIVHIAPTPSVTISINHVDSALCHGSSDGNINTIPSLGTQPYSYVWNTNPPQYAQNAIHVPAGTYIVTISDFYGCTNTATATVHEPTALTVTIAGYTPVLCNGQSNGTASATVSGGTQSYIVSWDDLETTFTATHLNVGTHTVTITDHNGCTANNSVLITQPNQLGIVLTPDSVRCFGTATGGIADTVTGGTPNYLYTWNNGSHSQNLSNVVAGTYSVIVIDHNGCKDSAIATILQPFKINSSVYNADTIMECNGDNDGTITINGTGGVWPLTYHWNTGASGITINNLPGGYHPNGGIYTYTDTITDHNGCKNLHTVHVYQPSVLNVHLDSINVQCKSDCNGQVSLYATGATPWHNGSNIYYHYLWDPNSDTTTTIIGLCAGIYSLTVTDSNGCTTSKSTVVNVNNNVTAGFNANPTTGYVPLPVNFTYTGTGDTVNTANIYTWTFGDGTISSLQDPSHTYLTQDTFRVCLKITNGVCRDSTCQLIYPETPSTMIVPNVFTPNGDGHNDFFQVKYHNIETFNCVIFNRWGNKIYEWSDVSKGWDGKTSGGAECSDGTYFYIINAKGTDNTDWNSHGIVTLLRK
jgi:gliding motility-associated-like protein